MEQVGERNWDPSLSHGTAAPARDCLPLDNFSSEIETTYLVQWFFLSSCYTCNPNRQKVGIEEAVISGFPLSFVVAFPQDTFVLSLDTVLTMQALP